MSDIIIEASYSSRLIEEASLQLPERLPFPVTGSMKILTKEEEAEHDRATWEGGILGCIGGAAVGSAAVYAASARYHAFRTLSVPFRAFLVTGSTAFAGVISADRYSRAFERSRHAGEYDYVNKSESAEAALAEQKTVWERTKGFVSEQRYPIVFGSWVASMAIALGLVGRSPYLTGQQKLVQARVYAQTLTLAVLVASFALEGNDLRSGKGRWETVKVLDPEDPEHKRMIEKRVHHEAYQGEDQWMDMLDAQEKRMKARGHDTRSKKEKEQDAEEEKKEVEEVKKKGKDSSSNTSGKGS